MMESGSVDIYGIIDIFLLLLIGVSPKIALVPFLQATAHMDNTTRGNVSRKMLTTASVVAIVLVVLGELLTKLLHFSTGALSIAGGVILLIIAISMVLGAQNSESPDRALTGEDPLKLAVFPLAVPYLLNPAGMVVLVTLSAEAQSVGLFIVVIGVLGLVIALDALVFGFANRVSQHLDESRMLVTEKVFGFLLAALAVQLGLNGLADIGVIQLTGH